MTIEELQVIFDQFPPEMQVTMDHEPIASVIESSHHDDPENETGENYLVLQ